MAHIAAAMLPVIARLVSSHRQLRTRDPVISCPAGFVVEMPMQNVD
jgi:hypothetical protein